MSNKISDFDRKVDATAKVVFIGESAVGKSSLALRITKDMFLNYMETTVGAAFLLKYINVNNKTIKLEIWDTAGQERYHCLVPMYYRHAKLAFVVYDTTDLKTFIRAKDWIRELNEKAPKDIIIVLIGNKIDDLTQRKVCASIINDYIKDTNYMYYEVSAKSGEGVTDLLNSACAKLLDPSYIASQKIINSTINTNITNNNTNIDTNNNNNTLSEKKSYCCSW